MHTRQDFAIVSSQQCMQGPSPMVMQGGNGMGPYTGPSMVVGSPSEFADSASVANASVWTVEPLTVARH